MKEVKVDNLNERGIIKGSSSNIDSVLSNLSETLDWRKVHTIREDIESKPDSPSYAYYSFYQFIVYFQYRGEKTIFSIKFIEFTDNYEKEIEDYLIIQPQGRREGDKEYVSALWRSILDFPTVKAKLI
jgi:hypothetical protein